MLRLTRASRRARRGRETGGVQRGTAGDNPTGCAFADRADAGRQLAARLHHLGRARPVVLGLPRGGVPVAAEVARALGAPLDVVLVRKVGVPGRPELAVGAVGEGGVRVVNEEVRQAAHVDAHTLATLEAHERDVLDRRAAEARSRGRHPAPLEGRCVVIVDDGIATGSTAAAACAVVRARGACRVVLAAPVAPSRSLAPLSSAFDELDAVHVPEDFLAIGQWYGDFSQTTEGAVWALLSAGRDGYGRTHGYHQ